jgi:hypothetical protein
METLKGGQVPSLYLEEPGENQTLRVSPEVGAKGAPLYGARDALGRSTEGWARLPGYYASLGLALRDVWDCMHTSKMVTRCVVMGWVKLLAKSQCRGLELGGA